MKKYKLIKNFIFFMHGSLSTAEQIPAGTIIETTDSGNYHYINKERQIWLEIRAEIINSNPDIFQLVEE